MLGSELRSTREILREAEHTQKITKSAIDGLEQARTEVMKTIAYLRWCRFLGYDRRALEFLEHLDLEDPLAAGHVNVDRDRETN